MWPGQSAHKAALGQQRQPGSQSGEVPNQVYFAESSLQFQKACVLGHWFSGFPEQGFGGEQSKDGPAGLGSPPPT